MYNRSLKNYCKTLLSATSWGMWFLTRLCYTCFTIALRSSSMDLQLLRWMLLSVSKFSWQCCINIWLFTFKLSMFGPCMSSGHPAVVCPRLKLTRPPSCWTETTNQWFSCKKSEQLVSHLQMTFILGKLKDLMKLPREKFGLTVSIPVEASGSVW